MCSMYGVWQHRGKPVDRWVAQQPTNILRHCSPDDEDLLLVNTQTWRTPS